MTQSDGQLLSRIAAGDERAFEALFERHGEAVRRHLQRMLRAPGAADDVLQEVLLRVWMRAGQWARTRPSGKWFAGSRPPASRFPMGLPLPPMPTGT